MDNNFLSLSTLKIIVTVLIVLIIGIGLIDIGLTYMYKKAGKPTPCDLCFEINPEYEDCKTYIPPRFLWNKEINFTS